MPYDVVLRHNFETAHRLPHLDPEGKCANLHGHSWWVEWRISAEYLDDKGTVVEFGAAKRVLRDWVDENLDHGTMLGHQDALVPLLRDADGQRKLYVFGEHPLTMGLDWPTVENVARLLHRAAENVLKPLARGALVHRVTETSVQETHVNRAVYRP